MVFETARGDLNRFSVTRFTVCGFRFLTLCRLQQTLRRLIFCEMPKPKGGSSGAELAVVRAQVKRLKKKVKDLTTEKREVEIDNRVLKTKLSAMETPSDSNSSADSVDDDDSRDDGDASAVANTPRVAPNEASQAYEHPEAQTAKREKPDTERETHAATASQVGPQALSQCAQLVTEGHLQGTGLTQTRTQAEEFGGTASKIVVTEKIRRPKVAAAVTKEEHGFVTPIQNGFLALRAINRERGYGRASWYFACVKRGEVGIRRKITSGVVQGIQSCGLDDVDVLEHIVIDGLPKTNKPWVRPQQQQEQQKETQKESVATTLGSKSVTLSSAPSVGASGDDAVTTSGAGSSNLKSPTMAANNNGSGATATVSTSQGVSTTKVSAAQQVSDSCAWDEIMPMVADVLAEEVRAGIRLDQQEVFRLRCTNGPFAAVAKGHFLTTLVLRKEPVQDLASRALAKSTVMSHKRVLRALMKLPERYWELPLDRAMEQYFLDEKAAKKWLPTTTVVKMANAHGALRLLPLYVEKELPVLMRESVIWTQAMKAAAKCAKQMPPQQPTAATWAEVAQAVKSEPVVAIKMAVLMAWLTFGRGGDVLLLKPSDVVMTSKESAGKEGGSKGMAVSFWKGKTVKTRGSYTVFTQPPPPEFLEEFVAFHKAMRAEQYLFKGVAGAQIKIALRRANPQLEQRSLRRGAIQAVAATGISDTEMLHYSGHTNVAMLRRYLNFGKLSGEGAKLSSQAAALVQNL